MEGTAPVRCRALCDAIWQVQGDPRQCRQLHSSENASTLADIDLVRFRAISRSISFVNRHVSAEAGGGVWQNWRENSNKIARAAAMIRPPNDTWCRSVGGRPTAAALAFF